MLVVKIQMLKCEISALCGDFFVYINYWQTCVIIS
jgi:hypothetical protein